MTSNQSRYPEAYARWRADPEGILARRRARDRLVETRRQGVRSAIGGSSAAGSSAQNAMPATTPSIAMWSAAVPTRRPSSMTVPSRARSAPTRMRNCRTKSPALAAVLQDLGVEKGDRVVLYMPMIPQAVFGMLACARIGAVHSVVFGGFAAERTRDPAGGCDAQGHPDGFMRHRDGSCRSLQTSARRGDRA